jgi:peptidase E
MRERVPQIVAFGGGGFSMEAGNSLLDDYVLALTGKPRPRVCFLPTASGDADHYVVRFYQHFGPRAETSHLSLFRRERGCRLRPREHLLDQDLIYVGGGSVISMLGVWRAHGIDAILREAWSRGVVLCGLSAGSLCWFAQGVSAFHGDPAAIEGLGLLPWSNAVHYDGESPRRADYHAALRDGMGPGYAASDGAALHFEGTELAHVVASRPGARAFRVEATGDEVSETELAVRFLREPVLTTVAA